MCACRAASAKPVVSQFACTLITYTAACADGSCSTVTTLGYSKIKQGPHPQSKAQGV